MSDKTSDKTSDKRYRITLTRKQFDLIRHAVGLWKEPTKLATK